MYNAIGHGGASKGTRPLCCCSPVTPDLSPWRPWKPAFDKPLGGLAALGDDAPRAGACVGRPSSPWPVGRQPQTRGASAQLRRLRRRTLKRREACACPVRRQAQRQQILCSESRAATMDVLRHGWLCAVFPALPADANSTSASVSSRARVTDGLRSTQIMSTNEPDARSGGAVATFGARNTGRRP